MYCLFKCEYIKGHKEIVDDLIEKIVKNFLDNEAKITLFDKLAYIYDKKILKQLITKIQLSIEEKNILLDNIINKKIRKDNCSDFFEVIQILLNNEILDITSLNNNETTLLHSICNKKNTIDIEEKEYLELLKFLLDNKNISINDINAKDKDGNTALDSVIKSSNFRIAYLLARRFQNKNLLLKDENKGKLLENVALTCNFNLFLKLYKPDFLDPKSNLYVPNLFENACIGGNKEIIEVMINSLKIENLEYKDISKLFNSLYRSIKPNINTINLLTNLVNKNKINNLKNIFDVRKNKGQGSDQTSIYRSFEYDNNKNVNKMTDFVYSKITNKEIKNEQTFLLYKIDYNDSD